jgi:tetratricopeptide (TPR) repeat protein
MLPFRPARQSITCQRPIDKGIGAQHRWGVPLSLENEPVDAPTEAIDPKLAALRQGTVNRGDAPSYGRYGQALLRSTDLAGAEQAFRKAAELDPKSWTIRLNLASVLNRRGSRTEAIELLRMPFEDGSADAGTCAQLAILFRQLGDLDGAERAIRRAIECRPEQSRYRLDLVNVLHWRGKKDEAMSMLRELATNIADAEGLCRTGRMLGMYGDRAASEAMIRRAIALDPKPPYRLVLAESLFRWQRLREALPWLWELKAEEFAHEDIGEMWEKSIARLGGLESVELSVQRELRSNPDDASLRGLLAELLKEQGRVHGAIAVLSARGKEGLEDSRIRATLQRLQAMRDNPGNIAERTGGSFVFPSVDTRASESVVEAADQPLTLAVSDTPPRAEAEPRVPRGGFRNMLRRLTGRRQT